MTDLNRKPNPKPEDWQPDEIAVAVLALVIWLPLAYIIGGLL